MRKLPTRKLLAALIAGALFVPTTGFTLGLGEIEVNSALNQRLDADIELLATTPEDTENIIIKLASRKEFSRAGLDRPYLLNDLRFKSEVIDGVVQIKVSSSSPIREPFINFLIEIDWPNGHLLREYTVLLDPPVFMTQSTRTTSVQSTDNSDFRPAASVATNIAPVVATPAVQTAAPASSASTFMPAPVVQQQTPTKQPAASYRVKSGDTAWRLADAMRPNQNISVPQMLMAMLHANPESFINGNINGLKRGYILRAPDAAQIAAISQEDARAMVSEHGALWRQYQQAKSGAQSTPAVSADSKPAQTGSNTDSAASTTSKEDAHLAIVAGDGTSTVGGKNPADMSAEELRAELALSRERVETERVEKEALRNRVDTLEQRAVKNEGMLAIENEELSTVQSLNAPAGDSAAETDANAEMAEGALTGAEEVGAETDEPAAMSAENATDEIAVTTEEVANDVPSEDAVFTDEVSGQSEDTAPLNTAVMPEATEPAMDNTSPEPAADPLTQLLDNPTLLAAAGGGLLLFVAMIALINKRRKAGEGSAIVAAATVMSNTDADLESLADDIAEEKAVTEEMTEVNEEVHAETESPAEDLAEKSTEEAVVAEVEPEAVEEARDDVIAEADVYLAYGIYQQAEDLLKQALVDHPENDSYREKLAETFYTSKNAGAFLEVANELKQRVDDDSAAWAKVMKMGEDLCADDPMFQGEMVGELNLDATEPGELPVDFGADNDVVSAEPSDLNLDDGTIELPDLDIEEESVAAVDVVADSSSSTEDEMLDMPVEPVDEIEFDLSDTDATEEESAAEDEFSLDIDASELDISSEDEATIDAAAEEESFDLGDIEIALDEEDTSVTEEDSSTDVDFNLDDATEALEEEVSLDLSDEVEVESLESESTENIDAVSAANDDSAEDGDFDLSSLDDTDEISTKLDLARAYMDMGDHDGTRDILDEVLADGNDDQKQEANDLMQKLN